jgi:hypothetical protein
MSPADHLPPASLLLLGVAALGASIDAVVAEGGDAPRVSEHSPMVMLLLGVLALRDRLDRRLGPLPTSVPTPGVAELRGVLR